MAGTTEYHQQRTGVPVQILALQKLAVWPWATYLSSLSLALPNHEIRTITYLTGKITAATPLAIGGLNEKMYVKNGAQPWLVWLSGLSAGL